MNKKLHNKNFVLKFIFVLFILGSALNVAKADNIYEIMQQREVTINMHNKLVKEVLNEIQKQTNLNFVYNENELSSYSKKSLNVKNEKVDVALNRLFEETNLTYKIVGNTITIVKKPEPKLTAQVSQTFVLSGKVIEKGNKAPVVGATVIVASTGNGAITDDAGKFEIKVKEGDEIEVSFTGMVPVKIKASAAKSKNMIIEMQSDAIAVDDVIITGIYNRNKESFTGSAATYSAKQLKQIGGNNILQSLKTLDPTFVMLESKKYGSDPNRLPDIEIRGTTSVAGLKTEFGEDPNRPLFILDGVESDLSSIINLNMDRIASITVLKDAASTAIYGSKAANGVIVVETLQPQAGKLRLNYNGSFKVQIPDLSGYNLMNAAEKLQFELIAGQFDPSQDNNLGSQIASMNRYYEILKEINRGVDSYWLSEPIRTVFNHTHNISVDGGDHAMRYGIGVNYNGNNGVMKGSNNSSIGANFSLIYRVKNLIFSNRFNTSINSTEREPVAFSEYSKQNPYYRKYNDDGSVKKYLYRPQQNESQRNRILNPMYVALQDKTQENKSNSFVNAFSVEWSIFPELRVRGRINLSQNNVKDNSFISPTHPDFDTVEEKSERGSYSYSNQSSFSYDGDLNITYGKLFREKHQVNLVGGWNFNERTNTSNGYSVKGFVSDKHKNPQFSSGFKEGQKPTYSKSIARATSFYFNGNYSFKNRYLIDANFRADATSRFGAERLFSSTWAVGLAWNIHNEKFFENVEWMNNLKIRASVGNPGNQNFDPYLSNKTYLYNVTYQNYFGPSAIIEKFGNPNLKWQRTLDKNIGFDMAYFHNRLRLTFDYYNKKTDPLLMAISVPISTGTSSIQSNLGGQISTGASGSIMGIVMSKKDISWSVNYNFRFGKAKYFGIGSTLSKLNNDAINGVDSNNNNNLLKSLTDTDSFKRYYDGADPNDLYAVRSLGIDPATGRELYLNKRDEVSFKYNIADEIKVGNSRPDIEGVLGTSFTYKGFSFSLNVRYSFGADVMASALFQKVENISNDKIKYNQDKRALYDRWQKPGDIAKYTSLENVGAIYLQIPMSSRFLVRENTVSLESISFGYETSHPSLRKVGLSGISFNVYMNDILRISSLKEERGLDYPFARTVSCSIGLRF